MFVQTIYSRPFIGLLFANMFFWMSTNFFLPVLPLHYHSLGMNDHQVGLAIGMFSVGSVLLRVFSGKATDRYGSKPVITLGIMLATVAIISYYFNTTLWGAAVSRFLHGMGISVYAAAALTMATFMHDERHTTEAVAYYTLFTMLGVGIASSTAIWIYQTGELPLVLMAGVIATILSLILFPKHPKLKIKPQTGQPLPLATIVSDPGIYVPTISLFAVNMCFGSVMTFLPLFLLSCGVTEIQFFYVAYAITVIFTRLWVSKLCILLTPQRLTVYILLALSVCMGVIQLYTAGWALILSGIIIGAGYGLAFPALATIISANTQPANRGAAFGFFSMAVDIGFGVGAIGMGIIAEVWGYQAVFLTAGAYTLGYTVLYCLRLYHKVRQNHYFKN